MYLKTNAAYMLVVLLFALLSTQISALTLDVNDEKSIRAASSILAQSIRNLYNGSEPGGHIGKWPYLPYYWWESGGAWGSLMHYWAFTHDDTYNNLIMQALTSQLGPNNDFVMEVEAFDEGNDDQAFWAFVALAAAEYNFPDPPLPLPPWSTIVENVFNEYVHRWNTSTCGGGLKWQFHPENAGFYYKQTISNGAFFQVSARLARYTGNNTYLDWANKVWDWTVGVGLMSATYDVFDGTDEKINCTQQDHHQWTYNVGVFLYGAAVLSNYTNQSQTWVDRTTGLLAAADVFFTPYQNATNIMFEAACETIETCNTDQYSMKAYLARWMAATSIMAPYTGDKISTYLRASAIGAASACTGGPYGNTCGIKWYTGSYEGNDQYGLGQQMSALEVVVGLLANNSIPPRTQPAQVPPPIKSVSSSTTTTHGTVSINSSAAPTSQNTSGPITNTSISTLPTTVEYVQTGTSANTSTSVSTASALTNKTSSSVQITSFLAGPSNTISRVAVSVQTTNIGSKLVLARRRGLAMAVIHILI